MQGIFFIFFAIHHVSALTYSINKSDSPNGDRVMVLLFFFSLKMILISFHKILFFFPLIGHHTDKKISNMFAKRTELNK